MLVLLVRRTEIAKQYNRRGVLQAQPARSFWGFRAPLLFLVRHGETAVMASVGAPEGTPKVFMARGGTGGHFDQITSRKYKSSQCWISYSCSAHHMNPSAAHMYNVVRRKCRVTIATDKQL